MHLTQAIDSANTLLNTTGYLLFDLGGRGTLKLCPNRERGVRKLR